MERLEETHHATADRHTGCHSCRNQGVLAGTGSGTTRRAEPSLPVDGTDGRYTDRAHPLSLGVGDRGPIDLLASPHRCLHRRSGLSAVGTPRPIPS